MTVIVNPFDAGGFTLAEMSAAIQMLPNPYGRVGQLGLFAPEPISQRNVTIESIEGELRLLPAVAPGAFGRLVAWDEAAALKTLSPETTLPRLLLDAAAQPATQLAQLRQFLG